MEQLAFWVQFWVVTMTWLLSQVKFSWSSQDCVAHWLCFMTACSGTGGREGIEDWSAKSFDTVLSVVVSRKSSSLWYRNDIKSSCFGKAWLFFIGTTHLDLTLSVLLDCAVANGNFYTVCRLVLFGISRKIRRNSLNVTFGASFFFFHQLGIMCAAVRNSSLNNFLTLANFKFNLGAHRAAFIGS